MDDLADILGIVTNRAAWSPDLPNLDLPKTRVDKFIAGIKANAGNKSEPTDGIEELPQAHRMLKSRAKRKLLNALFFLSLDKEKYSELAIAMYENQKKVFWTKILLSMGARNSATQVAREGLAQAMNFNLTPNAIEFAIILRSNAALSGSRSEFERLDQLVQEYVALYNDETVAMSLVERVNVSFVLTTAEQPHLAEAAERSLLEIESRLRIHSSHSLVMSRFRAATLSYQISQRFQETVKVCDEVQEYFDLNPQFFSPSRYGQLLLSKLESLIYLQDFVAAHQVASDSEKAFHKGSNNWFIQRELVFMLAMQSLDFIWAEGVMREVIRHHRFEQQPGSRQEKWEVYQVFLNYALAKPYVKWPTDLSELLSRVPTYAKDKKGLNVSLLIAHTLFLVRDGKLDEVILRMEALQTYHYRYLRGKTNNQSSLFFKLLKIIENESFDLDQIEKKSARYVAQLQSSTASYAEIREGLQILPYEWMWNSLMRDLKKQSRKKQPSSA